jgi:glycosyltransferase involved in cell wall biosynthesis
MEFDFPQLPDIVADLSTGVTNNPAIDKIAFLITKNRFDALRLTLPTLATECDVIYVVDSSTDDRTERLCASYPAHWNIQYHGPRQQRAVLNGSPIMQKALANDFICHFTVNKRDIAAKRNYIILLALLYGFQNIIFLDDDVIAPPKLIANALSLSTTYGIVGAGVTGMPDLSVIDHIAMLNGVSRPFFLSGHFMAINLRQASQYFFPNMANEDWYYVFLNALRLRIARIGHIVHLYWNPFDQTESRAAYEEEGEIIIEGLMRAIGDSRNTCLLRSEAHWSEVISRRRDTLKNLGLSPVAQSVTAIRSIVASAERANLAISAQACMKCFADYDARLSQWRLLVEESVLGEMESAGGNMLSQGRSDRP